MMSKAEARRQKAESAAATTGCKSSALGCLLAAFLILVLAAGCTEQSSPAAVAANSVTAESSAPKDPAPDTTKKPARDITFDTIKFEMRKDEPFQRSMITPAIERLEKSKIRIRGYILPSVQQTLTQFVLVRDNMQCCFGPGAALFDCIVVEMDPGQTTEYTSQPVAVEGVFSINELRNEPEGKCLAIYHLQAQRVQ